MNWRYILYWVAWLTRSGIADSSNTVVFVNLAPEDKEISATQVREVEKIKLCGYQVQDISLPKLNATGSEALSVLDSKLAALKLQPGSYLFINSHGGMVAEDGYIYPSPGKDEEPRYDMSSQLYKFHFFGDETGKKRLFSGKDLMSTIKNNVKGGQLWVDACAGGGCRYCTPDGIGVAMACSELETTPVSAQNQSVVTDLLCSAKKDCAEWKLADGNRDGLIDGTELERYLDQKNQTERTERNQSARLFSGMSFEGDFNLKRPGLEKNCKDKNGVLEVQTLGYKLKMDCKTLILRPNKPDHISGSGCSWDTDSFYREIEITTKKTRNLPEFPDHFESREQAVAFLKTVYSDWPQKCGSRKSGEIEHQFLDCDYRLENEKPEVAWTCRETFKIPRSRKRDVKARVIKDENTVIAGAFTLRAPQCADKTPDALSPHPSENQGPADSQKSHAVPLK